MKRTSLRFNLHKEKSRNAWEALEDYKQFGYTSRQDFIRDAVTVYHGWLVKGNLPYTREELESEMKRWIQEVMIQCRYPVEEHISPPKHQEEKMPEEGLIDNSILAMANDFLSTL